MQRGCPRICTGHGFCLNSCIFTSVRARTQHLTTHIKRACACAANIAITVLNAHFAKSTIKHCRPYRTCPGRQMLFMRQACLLCSPVFSMLLLKDVRPPHIPHRNMASHHCWNRRGMCKAAKKSSRKRWSENAEALLQAAQSLLEFW